MSRRLYKNRLEFTLSRFVTVGFIVCLWCLAFSCSPEVPIGQEKGGSQESNIGVEAKTEPPFTGKETTRENQDPESSTSGEGSSQPDDGVESPGEAPPNFEPAQDGGDASDESSPEEPAQGADSFEAIAESEPADSMAPEAAPEKGLPEAPVQDKPSSTVAKRMVIAGDSWSSGLIQPTRAALNAKGFSSVQLSYKFTANAGSQAAGWVANKHPPAVGGGEDKTKPRMLTALAASLDASPRADVLMLVIGGNDYNRECVNGMGKLPKALQKLVYDKIQKDIQSLVDFARKGRPHLKIVLMGYDYFHFEFLVAFGLKINKGNTRKSYNEGLVELDRRKRKIADTTPNVKYAHHFGILQHTYGDKAHPPFPVPNPLTHPPYKPGVAPKPGIAPTYHPYPGGLLDYPAPLDVMPDGIHPSSKGFRTIVDYTLSQGLGRWLQGKAW